ncbi:hypothetical protein PilKf_00348 [Pillotina sp. SPG140]
MLFFIFLPVLFSCTAGTIVQEPESLTFVSWNVQTLYDGEDQGTEYTEYQFQAGWSEKKYQARLTSFAHVLKQINADVLSLIEVENAGILEDLNAQLGYQSLFFGANGDLLGIGIMSRYPIVESKLHSYTADKKTVPRPIVEIRIIVHGKPVVVMACHWKSKSGGEDAETEQSRRNSAQIVRRRLQELQTENPLLPVLIMGDLNERYDEFEKKPYITALMPDSPEAVNRAGTEKDFLIISTEKPPVARYFPADSLVLYSPWGNELHNGSYYYQKAWETIDHILVNTQLFDGNDWDFKSSTVLNTEPFVNANGIPNRYNPSTGNGLSDHLPLQLTINFIQ